jgi:Fe-S oxidoreductase
MTYLAKLNLKTVQRNVVKDPVVARRDKLAAAIDEQLRVVAAALRGETHAVAVKRWTEVDGKKVKVDGEKRVRAWFFEQDNGWYVQCRYGSRVLSIMGKSNAVFVTKLDEVAGVLETFKAAALAGELDKAVMLATKARSA